MSEPKPLPLASTSTSYLGASTSLRPSDHFLPYKFCDRQEAFRFLQAEGYVVTSKQEEESLDVRLACYVHPRRLGTITGGSSMFFPYHLRHELYERIGRDIEHNVPFGWNQYAYEVEGCRLVVDIDSSGRVLTRVEQHSLAYLFWKTCILYFPEYEHAPFPIFAACCGPCLKKGRLGSALHFIAHVIVTVEQARQILFGYRLLLADPKGGFDMYQLEVDAQIYKSPAKSRPNRQVQHDYWRSGYCHMRMIYAQKRDVCAICGGRAQDVPCTFCHGQNMGVVRRAVYEPAFVLNREGKADASMWPDSFSAFVAAYSIWAEPEEKRNDYCKPADHPNYTIEAEFSNDVVVKRPARRGGPSRRVDRLTEQSTDSYVVVSLDHPAVPLLESHIQGLYVPGKGCVWEHVKVYKVTMKKVPEGKKPLTGWVFLNNRGSMYCPYVKREHSSRSVFFQVRKQYDSRLGVNQLTLNGGSMKVICKDERCCVEVRERPVIFELPRGVLVKLFGLAEPPTHSGAARGSGGSSASSVIRPSLHDFQSPRQTHVMYPGQRRQYQNTRDHKAHKVACIRKFYDLQGEDDPTSKSRKM